MACRRAESPPRRDGGEHAHEQRQVRPGAHGRPVRDARGAGSLRTTHPHGETMFKWLKRKDASAEDGRALVKSGYERFQNDDLDGAADDFSAACSVDPGNADAHYLLGLVALRRGAPLDGLRHVDAAIALQPDNAFFLYSRADALKVLGKTSEAIDCLRRALVLDPSDVKWWLELGSMLADAGRDDEALDAWREVVARDGSNVVALWEFGRTLKRVGRDDESAEAHARAERLASASTDATFDLALHVQSRSQHEEAARLYGTILEADPVHRAALANLGALETARGDHARALELLERAVGTYPDYVEGWINLATALRLVGRLDEARDAHLRALEITPASRELKMEYATTLDLIGERAQAEAVLHEVIAMEPGASRPHYLLGQVLHAQGHFDEAELEFRRAHECAGGSSEALIDLLMVQIKLGRLREAAVVLDEVRKLMPETALAYNNIGIALQTLKRPDEAEAALRRAAEIDPLTPVPHVNLANLLNLANRYTESESAARQALERDPSNADALGNLSVSLSAQGRHAESIEVMRRIVAMQPDNGQAWSNLLFTLNYREDLGPLELLDEHRAFDGQFAPPPGEERSFEAWDRRPDRKLRIGYVSPDFRQHVVAFFFEPLLDHHDRDAFEVFCYYNHAVADSTTGRLKQKADYWRDIAALSDDEVERIMREDRLDIAVDLAGHTAKNRLTVFARRVAPVQATWLGYPNGTGLRNVDWRITDAHADPSPETDAHYVERLWRVPDAFLVYRPAADSPEVVPTPCLSTGQVTFGAFNNYVKVTDEMLAVWVRILEAVPGSRLLVKTLALADEQVRDLATERFVAAGGDPKRLVLLGPTKTFRDHLATYGQVDVALDTYPYHGTTTTCEALWMGVPVVTLAGRHHAARVGVSLLAAVGLQENVVHSTAEYVDRAVQLAADPVRLQALRTTIRSRVEGSPLVDERRFAAAMKDAYRGMWREWVQPR
ncbi:MAG: tetratricopeptide repeat protein [Betaproteobacteria bacterium]|nr:tetratricopeptide repeat protein [Betaproteobacteria bacterium]